MPVFQLRTELFDTTVVAGVTGATKCSIRVDRGVDPSPEASKTNDVYCSRHASLSVVRRPSRHPVDSGFDDA